MRGTDSIGEEALRVLCVEQLRERVWLTICSERASVQKALYPVPYLNVKLGQYLGFPGDTISLSVLVLSKPRTQKTHPSTSDFCSAAYNVKFRNNRYIYKAVIQS